MFNFSFKDRDTANSKINNNNKIYEIEKPANVKAVTSSKFINNIKDNYQIKEELNNLSKEIDDCISKNRNVPLTNIRLKLNNIINNCHNEALTYFLMAKVLNYFKDYYEAYRYINISIDKGYLEYEDIRKELLEKVIKFKSIDNYHLEQELYKTIQLFSKEQSIYKVSFKKEDIQKIEAFYNKINNFVNELSTYESRDKFIKPCNTLLNNIIGILENSVLYNIFYESLNSRLNFISILDKYPDIDKTKVYFAIYSQLEIFKEVFSNMNLSRNSDLVINFNELLNIIENNYSIEDDFLNDFLSYDDYNDFEKEREEKILTLHKVKVNIKDNSKLIGVLIKGIELYDNISSDSIPNIVDYIDELEYIINFLKKNIEVSISFILKLELIVSSYLSWFLLLYEMKNEVNYLANQILEINMKKLKLCL